MSMLYVFKPWKDLVLGPASRRLLAAGITPNMVTASGVLLSAAAGLLAAYGYFYAGILLFVAGACLDAVDGSFARACGLSSDFGRYFDSLSDRCSELLFIVGVVIGGAPASAFVVIAGSAILMVSRIYNHGKGMNSNAAMFGRPERLALLLLGLLSPAPYNSALFLAAGLLCFISALQVLASGFRSNKNVSSLPD